MKHKLVFKRPIAQKLQEKGHILVDAFPNRNNPKLTVYKFLETERLIKDLEKLKAQQ